MDVFLNRTCGRCAVPGWLTDMVRVIPEPETVIVPVRVEPVLAVALTVIEPLFEPEAGETVSHDVELLTAVQLILEVTVTARD